MAKPVVVDKTYLGKGNKLSEYLFAGLKVIDCATVIAAPAAAMMLADYGADVIKIEQPGEGDMLRILGDLPTTPYADSDWFWQLDGRNKRGMALDLKQPAGLEILRKLVAGCDVFITNQPYSVRESLGITYEDLKPLNPSLIYGSLTAYGEKGPERYRKGFDQLAYWARSGLMELMREPGTSPTQGLPGMGDHPTAVALYAGIVTALLKRERSGEGGMVETSLLANGLWSVAGIAQGVMANGDMPLYRSLNKSPPAMMRPYETSDGRWLQFNMIRNEDLQSLLFVALDAPELLSDLRFNSQELMFENRELLGLELQKSSNKIHPNTGFRHSILLNYPSISLRWWRKARMIRRSCRIRWHLRQKTTGSRHRSLLITRFKYPMYRRWGPCVHRLWVNTTRRF